MNYFILVSSILAAAGFIATVFIFYVNYITIEGAGYEMIKQKNFNSKMKEFMESESEDDKKIVLNQDGSLTLQNNHHHH